MRGDSGVAGEGRVVGVPKVHSWGKYTMPSANINSDWMSNASFGLRIWASVSEPHTSELNRDFESRFFIEYYYWGERSEPHTCGENGKLSIYLFIYIYIWYVRIPYMHSALFVRDAIFPH